MGYEPLHHKYRPQTFADLVGQEAIATTLSHAIEQQRIAPAYLFTGARGTGKTSTARIMAKSLNCLQKAVPTPLPCGICEMCQAITKGVALDVTEIDAASNTGVDNIREIIERAQFAAVKARYKVYVIDECHMLSNAAFNALLKTLEEPPDRVVFILATTDPQRVLPTIISRCQRFDFRRIPLEAMVAHLSQIATIEGISITPEAVTLVAQLAQGGLRDGESLLDQLSLWTETITPAMVWDLVGAVPEQDLLNLLAKIQQKDSVGLLEKTRQILDRGREPLTVLQSLAGLYRDLLIAQSAPQRQDLVAWTTEGWQELGTMSRSMPMATLFAGQQHLRSAEVQIKNTTQPRLWLEVTLLGLLESPTPSSTPSPQIAPIPPREAQAQTPTYSSTSPQPPQPQPVPAIATSTVGPSTPPSLTPIPDRDTEATWKDILSRLSPSSKGLFSSQGKCLAITGNHIKIGLNSKEIYKIAERKKEEVVTVCEKYFKRSMQVSLEIITAKETPPPPEVYPIPAKEPPKAMSPAPAPQEKEVSLPIAPQRLRQKDQALENLVHLFNGEVIDYDREEPPEEE